MRNRATPRSAGLLNGPYDKHDGKVGRCNGPPFAWLAAAAVAVTCLVLVYKHEACPIHESLAPIGDITASRPKAGGEAAVSMRNMRSGERDSLYEPKGSSIRHKRPKKARKGSERPRCTDSILKEKEVYPVYGCEEMKEMLDGETTYLGRGYWREVRLAEYGGQQVAIKTLRDDQEESKRNRQRHRWEAVALDQVKDHPNIVHVLGLCDCDMVTEYFPYYMDVVLMGPVSSSSDGNDSREELPHIPMRHVVRMALEAARGLQALHEMPGGPVVHADLQPRQLLLDKSGTVKVNDLNRCRFMGRDADGKPCPFNISKANGVWRSPEEFAGEELTEKLDIYSMGNIFWAMLGRDAPFVRDDYYKGKVLSGERPKVDPSWHPEFVQLFQDMWQRDPKARPDAREVVLRLEKMYAELPSKVKPALDV
ncbi:unnamed protein product [Pylaiella littoralis]